jgi:hypothetical protein
VVRVTLTPLCQRRGCTAISIALVDGPDLPVEMLERGAPAPVRLCARCEHELALAGSIELKPEPYE